MSLPPRADDRDQQGAGDIVHFGNPARPWSRRRWPGRLALASLLAAAVLVVIVRSGSHHRPPPPPVAVTDIGHPILGVHAGWELFGLDARGIVAVQFARGRIVRTTLPALQSNGPVSFVVAPGEALVRPLDNVPGYRVPDGKPARRLTGVLAHGGILLPGPSPREEWFDNNGTLLLIGPHGVPIDAHLAPDVQAWLSQPSWPVMSDGRGGVVLVASDGALYDAGSGLTRLVSALASPPGPPAPLLAMGSRYWLGLKCSASGCQNARINAATGALSTLPGAPILLDMYPGQALPGVVAPDGSTAAVIVPAGSDSQARLELINLQTGATDRTPVRVSRLTTSLSLGWSPDSRWLFVATSAGKLVVLNPSTGLAQGLDLGVSGLSQIVIRPAAG